MVSGWVSGELVSGEFELVSWWVSGELVSGAFVSWILSW